VVSVDIIPSETEEKKSGEEKETIWFSSTEVQKISDDVRACTYKYVMRVSNYANAIANEMNKKGIICELSSSISPIPDGYTVVLTFRVRGVRRDTYKKIVKTLSKEEEISSLSSEER